MILRSAFIDCYVLLDSQVIYRIERIKGEGIMRKMDEMELSISLKAIKWAWAYTILFLAIWIGYDYSKLLLIRYNLHLVRRDRIKVRVENYTSYYLS